MNTNNDAARVVGDFFAAFSQGKVDELVALFDEGARVHAVRAGTPVQGQPYGTYSGRAGVRQFVTGLGAVFETKEFTVAGIIGEGEVAFASGAFLHKLRSTSKDFASEWALRCVVRQGRIAEFRFYEDSAAFVLAAS